MPHFAISISEQDRTSLSVPPPPLYNKLTGELVPWGFSTHPRYGDYAVFKAENTVYVDEELDVYAHPGSHSHYRMMIRRMPVSADLRLIMNAAKHMMLISEYSIEYENREGLAPDMESGFWDVQYTVSREQMMADGDTLYHHDVVIPYSMRKRIWLELFSALGYKVKWGGSVLNVRKRKA